MMRRVSIGGLPITLRGLGLWACAVVAFGIWSLADHAVEAQGLDIDAVMWCDPAVRDIGAQTPEECVAARNLVFAYCVSCHNIVPVVKAQHDEAGWRATMATHSPRVPEMTSAEVEQVLAFLAAHYNPENPVPTLPPALENMGLNQAF